MLLLLSLCFASLTSALAAPPLVPAADLAGDGLEVWWREGELLAGVGERPDRRGVRPLADLAPIELPSDLSGWRRIGANCHPNANADATLGELPVVAELAGSSDEPVVQIRAGARVVASAALGRPARSCDIAVVQADGLPGLEVIVVWRPASEDETLRGVTVYHIPEIAR